MIEKDCGHSAGQGGEVFSLTSRPDDAWGGRCDVLVPFMETGELVGQWAGVGHREELSWGAKRQKASPRRGRERGSVTAAEGSKGAHTGCP